MIKKDIHFAVTVYNNDGELTPEDAALLTAAKEATTNAYAPYSHFLVGAVAALANGKTVAGSNQENASYPVGICAERVLLSCVATQYPGVAVDTIAISYHNTNGQSNRPVSPCGICRQSLAEYQERVQQPIRLILSGMQGEVYIVDNAKQLLPLSFSASDLG